MLNGRSRSHPLVYFVVTFLQTYCYVNKGDGSVVKSNLPLKDDNYLPVLAPGMSTIKKRGRGRAQDRSGDKGFK